ncbi:unnamed protein product [Symbiodinium natans]|uniref:Uncharacterized protein n=1 Tax=Symbiodinium natans TaxID=878477 RepID=A0A812RTL8_9DINO|nr:unnamed protein product [Symbiodinium natans]
MELVWDLPWYEKLHGYIMGVMALLVALGLFSFCQILRTCSSRGIRFEPPTGKGAVVKALPLGPSILGRDAPCTKTPWEMRSPYLSCHHPAMDSLQQVHRRRSLRLHAKERLHALSVMRSMMRGQAGKQEGTSHESQEMQLHVPTLRVHCMCQVPLPGTKPRGPPSSWLGPSTQIGTRDLDSLTLSVHNDTTLMLQH